MTTYSVDDADAARSFLEAIDLPPAARATRSAPVERSFSIETPEAIAVGSQMTEFAANVPVALRPHIANSLLLAQLAANGHIKATGGGSKEWYEHYCQVLANTGWVVENQAVSTRDVAGSAMQVHKEILPVIAMLLGPAVAAAAIVMAALNGLANMAKDAPWITLFHRESQRAHANQFQVGYVDVDSGDSPRISVACFELEAAQAVTQVLFFKFSDSSAKLRHFTSKLRMNEAIFTRTQALVEAKIADRAAAFIADIQLG
jgi:hypothetical protein